MLISLSLYFMVIFFPLENNEVILKALVQQAFTHFFNSHWRFSVIERQHPMSCTDTPFNPHVVLQWEISASVSSKRQDPRQKHHKTGTSLSLWLLTVRADSIPCPQGLLLTNVTFLFQSFLFRLKWQQKKMYTNQQKASIYWLKQTMQEQLPWLQLIKQFLSWTRKTSLQPKM